MVQQVALITGAAKRVGREIALALAHDGYDVAIHYRHSASEAADVVRTIHAIGRNAVAVQGDLCQADDAPRIIEEASAQLGALSVLIHNASVFERDNLASLSLESFALHMTVNLQAPLMLTQAFLAQLPEGVQGNILCLSDGLRSWSVSETFLSYSLSKMGLENMAQLLAPAIAPKARINTIALGATLPNVQDKPETFEKIRALTPLKCTSTPDDVVQAVRYVISASMLTGQVIDLTGGFSLQAPHKV